MNRSRDHCRMPSPRDFQDLVQRVDGLERPVKIGIREPAAEPVVLELATAR